ncbi:MAG: hypothetical protein Q7L55_07400 [Actinomycetota bacterium]|nr:hypothetical protein [Actinomycetota bacterium]
MGWAPDAIVYQTGTGAAMIEWRSSVRDDHVLGYTRGLSAFIAPFLLAAFVILYIFPTRTEQLRSWTIASTMTSMVLASAYAGGFYFFIRMLTERRWAAASLTGSRRGPVRHARFGQGQGRP